MLIEGLFRPGAKINPDHKSKYIFILAYAACVHETYKKVRYTLNFSLFGGRGKLNNQVIEFFINFYVVTLFFLRGFGNKK